ncbi:MAG TPA: inositol monophosphatase family protein, partial [Acidimicrobiales bacterium]|nr:inositol monophosphatase family protein [Acidimicrobiales bacterium]
MQPLDVEDPEAITALVDLAESCALDAAEYVRSVIDDEVRIADTKSSSTDLVTATDRAVEARIIDRLLAARPHDAILAEESGTRNGTSGVTWIIDPIDGTTNFVYGLAGFNISIAATHGGRVVAGVVSDPIGRETFRATLGGGSTCNGRPLRPSGPVDLGHALIGTGFSYLAERRRDQGRVVAGLIHQIRDIRRLGAAALDLCYVAAGRLDGYFESGLKPWDLAAGGLVAAESGCRLAGLTDDPPDERLTIAAPPALFAELRAALAEAAELGLAVEDPSARPGWKF